MREDKKTWLKKNLLITDFKVQEDYDLFDEENEEIESIEDFLLKLVDNL